jgi:hypothetical protein
MYDENLVVSRIFDFMLFYVSGPIAYCVCARCAIKCRAQRKCASTRAVLNSQKPFVVITLCLVELCRLLHYMSYMLSSNGMQVSLPFMTCSNQCLYVSYKKTAWDHWSGAWLTFVMQDCLHCFCKCEFRTVTC